MKLNDFQIDQQLDSLDGWRRDGENIVREYHFESFKIALAFVNRVADVAEWMNHHPDILLYGWSRVRLTVSTHDAGGLTKKDFELAKQVSLLA